ncbi:GNAT family N-acetyltransferase [Enterobacter asburiae]|nr:GNAT family N-acetyltransferase [Enterobacter bugandensis]
MLTTIEKDSDELLEPPLSLLSTEDCLSLENQINSLTDKLKSFRKLRELGIRIRPIEKKDNIQIASIIRHSFKVNKIDHYSGVSLNDPQLDNLSEYYSCPSRKYWVYSSGDKVLGGVGISKLDIKNGNYCEMQKLYLDQSCLNMGVGRQLIEFALAKAKLDGYEYCYIETLPELKKAINIYEKLGFEFIESAIVATGHDSCSVRMIKNLKVENH